MPWRLSKERFRHLGKTGADFSSDLQPALAEAIQQTRFTGKNLTPAVDDPQCLHRTIQVPPMTMDDLVPVLERKVKQEQTWEGAAVWKFRIGIQARGKQTVQLEIWPQRIIDSLVTTCHNLESAVTTLHALFHSG
ncbi:MAG: hypothetical protein R3B83_04035 [Nitrospirales bacterium]|nr:hypothetical protein [Nitrospirales bacterium]